MTSRSKFYRCNWFLHHPNAFSFDCSFYLSECFYPEKLLKLKQNLDNTNYYFLGTFLTSAGMVVSAQESILIISSESWFKKKFDYQFIQMVAIDLSSISTSWPFLKFIKKTFILKEAFLLQMAFCNAVRCSLRFCSIYDIRNIRINLKNGRLKNTGTISKGL